MARDLLLGLLPDASSAEAAINDCVEAGLSERQISLLMADERTARSIIGDGGPLRGAPPADGAPKLVALGLSQADADAYANGVTSGQALLALSVDGDSRDGAREVLEDHGAHQISVVQGKG